VSEATTLFTIEQVAVRCGVEVTYVRRLVQTGVIEPDPEQPEHFRPEVTLRVQKAARLEGDLGVNAEGIAVILDLLDQIDRLERRLRR
jgi:chaperone modulatory protein CbpM